MKNPEDLTFEETYDLHNNIMALAHEQLCSCGRSDLADRLQKMAQAADGAFILHTVLQVALDVAYLDASTEPQTTE